MNCTCGCEKMRGKPGQGKERKATVVRTVVSPTIYDWLESKGGSMLSTINSILVSEYHSEKLGKAENN